MDVKDHAQAIDASVSRLAELIPNISDTTLNAIYNDIRAHDDRAVATEWSAEQERINRRMDEICREVDPNWTPETGFSG